MPTEGYEHVRAMPRLPKAAYGNLDYKLQMIVRGMEQRVFGAGEKPLPEIVPRTGRVPANDVGPRTSITPRAMNGRCVDNAIRGSAE